MTWPFPLPRLKGNRALVANKLRSFWPHPARLSLTVCKGCFKRRGIVDEMGDPLTRWPDDLEVMDTWRLSNSANPADSVDFRPGRYQSNGRRRSNLWRLIDPERVSLIARLVGTQGPFSLDTIPQFYRAGDEGPHTVRKRWAKRQDLDFEGVAHRSYRAARNTADNAVCCPRSFRMAARFDSERVQPLGWHKGTVDCRECGRA